MAGDGLIERFNLRSRLRFNIDAGQIWLDESRMLLMHAKAVGALRSELFDTLGPRRAQGLLLRMGFASGQQDADLAAKLYGEGDNYDVFRIGPELHAFEGLVKATITEADIDWEKGIFIGEVDWEGSWEAEAHTQRFGVGDDTACWSLVGYASGYATRFFKRLIVFRETHCVSRGDERCHIVGKPAEAWGDDPYLAYFKPENIDGQMREMEEELLRLRGRLRDELCPGKLVGNSQGFRAAFALLSKAAASPINVLLLGETGVGKEVFARWLHENGDRREQPFVAVNCGAIPHELIESELFGVQKGAYTGAQQSRPGRFERADGGTLFLDEVGDLSPSAQVKLLRVLQTGELERLGDERTRRVNVRLVAATNVNLQKAIAEGSFRADLYYRLATYPVVIPPLRERKSDIPLLVAALIEKCAPSYHKTIKGLTDRALQALMSYDWPGNVRELENLIERGVLLAPADGLIEVEHLFAGGVAAPPEEVQIDRSGTVCSADETRRERLCEALLDEGFDLHAHEARLLELAVRRAGGNLTHAARLLGISRRQLAYRLKQGTSDTSSD
ncbi:sigma 54-interacting transcriptional regulator [Thauera sp. CAU 1555]|uniref:Sigma 54-interacting transcriptional regulator n=1 Tax=Thauera sedimentorum TaxID=2767595 RepID=A0ABR9B605_9RHOO|nr:sigma-54-dependent Fis family transcriptional regulator [Thauera sedimentorum]MBC9070893.1 sigma 54-interacting transcriptional regulator [Thauera sedimentorum]MBD8501812.1 sigma 54-interacting transcriptional regulator [Thauera sedimentorum]